MTHNHEPTTEELNLQLYEKLEAEFAVYRAELINLPADEILEQAAGYVTREDILLPLEYTDLNRQQAEILLKSEHPLLDIYLKADTCATYVYEEKKRYAELPEHFDVLEFLTEVTDDADSKRLKMYSEESKMMAANKIVTAEDLHDFSESLSHQFKTLHAYVFRS